jgi:type I restriction enzyme S subunit
VKTAGGWKPLGEVCQTRSGGTPLKDNKEYYEGGTIPWLMSGEVSQGEIFEATKFISQKGLENSAARIFPKNTVLVAMYGATAGQVGILRFEAATNQAVCGILPNKQLLPEFLFYLFLAKKDELVAQATGNAQPNISQIKIKATSVPILGLAEQRRIVGILDEAFAGLATAKANAERNLQNARALFESYLEAAVAGRVTQYWRRAHPNTETAFESKKKKLTQHRTRSKESDNCKQPSSPIINKPLNIPEKWAVVSPEEISAYIVDCPHTTPKWTQSGVLCLRTTNFKPGFLDLESVQFVSEETYNERVERLKPAPGDVIYSREGGILGIACVIPNNLKLCLGQRMMLFRLHQDMALPEYFVHVMNSTLILSEVTRLTGGAASPHLNIRDIRTFPIPLPPLAEQHQIVGRLDAVSTETRRLESIYQQKLDALDELKKSLLHQAFTGQL